MTTRKEIDQIANCLYNYFGFLFDYGYEIVYTEDTNSFDNVLIILESKDAKIRFIQDRSEIDLAVGPAWAANSWTDTNYTSLVVILGFLEDFDEFKNYEGDLRDKDGQVKRLAEMFHPQFEKIISMVQIDTFPQAKRSFHAQWEKMMKNFQNQYQSVSPQRKINRYRK